MITLLMLACAGCATKDEEGTYDSGAAFIDDDSGPEACVATVLVGSDGTDSVIPEAGATDVYYREQLQVSFTADPQDAIVQVLDATGTALSNAVVTWSEGRVQAFVDVTLEPSTAYTLHVVACDVVSDYSFTTSSLGVPLTILPEDLVGRTYMFRLSDANITEPAFLDAVAGMYLIVPLLIGVTASDATTIDMLGALGYHEDDGSYTQIDGQPTWDFPAGDFAEQPYFEAFADQITITYSDIPVPIENFALSGTFTADGSSIAEGVATGFGDSRHMGSLVGREGDLNAMCEVAEAAGVICEACSDGAEYCLWIVAENITAVWQDGLTLTEAL